MESEVKSSQDVKLPRLDSYFWAIALILGGVIFGVESLGLLPQIGSATAWSWVLLGAGIVSLGLSLYAISSDSYSNPTIWDWVFGALIFAIGLGAFIGVDISLPVVLIVLGAAALLGSLSRR